MALSSSRLAAFRPALVVAFGLVALPAAAQTLPSLTQVENAHDRAHERLPDLNLTRGAKLKAIELEIAADPNVDGGNWTLTSNATWLTLPGDDDSDGVITGTGDTTITVMADSAALNVLDDAAGMLSLSDGTTTAELGVNVDVWPKLPGDLSGAALRDFLKNPENWPSDNSYHDDWERWGFMPDEVSHPTIEDIGSSIDTWEKTECPAGEPDRDDCVSPNQAGLATGMSADSAWLMSTGDPRIRIAVLDSGIKWHEADLLTKHYLNAEELRSCPPPGADASAVDVIEEFDVNGDGVFNIRDYDKADWLTDVNQNNLRDPQDLIWANNGTNDCSDGTDVDSNGFVDDISGWDFFWNDNDPSDDTDYGHGTGEAHDSGAEPHNGRSTVGFCPRCSIINVRVGDSFVVDANQFADGTIFAVESGARVVQEALGSLNNTPYMQKAIDYAYHNNVAVIASAADETSYHHNYPGNAEHTLYVHAIVADTDGDFEEAATFLNFGNCTNWGAKLALSTPGTGCSSEATGNTSGHAGLTFSYFEELRDAAAGTDDEAFFAPDLTAEELYQLLKMSADDIDVPGMEADPAALEAERYPSNEGWDLQFGYGRNNARRTLEALRDKKIPPEADISSPRWFEVIDPSRTTTVDIKGTVSSPRLTDLTWTLSVADGVLGKNPIEIGSGTGPVDNDVLATLDLSANGPLGQLVRRADAVAGTDPEEFTATLILDVVGTSPTGEVRGDFRKAFAVHTDPDMHDAFPIYLGASGESSPKLTDLDGDGTEEIVVATADGKIQAIDFQGNQLPGFPVSLHTYPTLDAEACAIANNPKCYRNAPAFQEGTAHRIDPDEVLSSVSKPSVAVGDLNGDGSPGRDVVAATVDGSVSAFGPDGQPLEGFPVWMDPSHVEDFEGALKCQDGNGGTIIGCRTKQRFHEYGFATSPMLVDLDRDGDLEIVIGAMDQYAYAWHHDGTLVNGWPVLLRNDSFPAFDDVGDIFRHDGRIVSDPVVADLFGDGTPIVVMGTNERKENSNEAFLYAIWPDGNAHDGGAYLDGWPAGLNGFIPDEILPFIGRGMPNAPAVADYDGDGKDEIIGAGIGGFPSMLNAAGENVGDHIEIGSTYYGINANVDEPAGSVPVINNFSVGDLDGDGRLEIINGTAGFGLVAVASNGGLRAEFDHSVSAWVADNGGYLDGFPHRVWDYQFFMNYAVADIDNDDQWNVIFGDGGYFVYAPDADGEEAPGFPKFTSQWHIATPSVGDLDGDGRIDVVANTREGWMYAWKTQGPVGKAGDIPAIQWASFHHDDRNTGNYGTPLPEREVMADPDDGLPPFWACSHVDARSPAAGGAGLVAGILVLGTLTRRRRRA